MSFNEEYKKIKKLITAELDIIEQKMVEPIDIQEPLKTHVINLLLYIQNSFINTTIKLSINCF